MVQTVYTHSILSTQKKIVLEKPHSLNRIFFLVSPIVTAASSYDIRMSFDDPLFHSSYSFQGAKKHFRAEGEDIFQGNIWVLNQSGNDLLVAVSEILR